MNKLVTVMMLSYNNIQFMKNALASVFMQNYEEIEIIINDDGTFDFNDAFINDIKLYIENNKKNNIVNYIISKNETNVGIIKSYNKVINLSKGNYLVPLCCDDEFYDENVVKDIVKYFNTSNMLIATGLRAYYDINLENIIEILPISRDIAYLNSSPIKLYNRLLRGNFIAGACTPYTREFIEKFGLYDEDYVIIEDWPRYLSITKRGCRIGFINRILIKYRHGGVTTDFTNNTIQKIISKDYKTMWSKEAR